MSANLKLRALLLQLQDINDADLLTLTRSELRELSDAAFDVLGSAEHELEERCGTRYDRPREEFEMN